jgi:hypothetical protein
MADGSGVRWGSVASNRFPLGTVLEVDPAPAGRRRWIVRDRIGWGTQLDFWAPTCGSASQGTVLSPAVRGLKPSSAPAARCCRPHEI